MLRSSARHPAPPSWNGRVFWSGQRITGASTCATRLPRSNRRWSEATWRLPRRRPTKPLDISRERVKTIDEPQALRDLSASLDNVGRVERDLGNLEAVRSAYRESLELCRRLREAVGDTPQALRDLSVSLNNVGQVERDLGNLEAARSAYRESLELRRLQTVSYTHLTLPTKA